MPLLFDKLFSSVAFSHMIVDVLNGQRAVLLAYLSGPLGLTNTLLGMVSTLYVMVGSLSQPVFGWLCDRFGPRWPAAGGVLVMAGCFSLAMVAPGRWALVFLMLASMGSAAFHPAGAMQATLRGRTHLSNRETTAAAAFFVFGQTGYFFGPLVGGPLLEHFGPAGLLPLSSLALPIGAFAARELRLSPAAALAAPTGAQPAAVRPGWLLVVAFALLAAFQAWSQQNMITFVPKYLKDLGYSASVYGLAAAFFMGGSALGNMLGGSLADRFERRYVAALALALAAFPLSLTGVLARSPWLFAAVPLAGALTGAVHSIIVVQAQRLVPGGMAFASGLILGFMFSCGALGTLLSGFLADRVGFPPVFLMTAGIALCAAALALTLKRD